ncbi:MAG: GNAT family N-acetyltransferase [Pseudomonadota bacterium]
MIGPALVRDMERGDAAAVLRLAADFSQETGLSPPEITPTDFARAAMAEPPLFQVFVAEPPDGGAPVGYLLLTFAFELRSGAKGGRMEDLYVAPRHRRRGVGRGLMAAATRAISADGGRWLEWRAAADDDAALAFYGRIGAKPAAGRTLYLGPESVASLARRIDRDRISLR